MHRPVLIMKAVALVSETRETTMFTATIVTMKNSHN